MIERIAVDALALRAELPELTLRVGASLVARVAAREAGHGVIVLAGVPLVAKLPPEVKAGQTLHMKVAELAAEAASRLQDALSERTGRAAQVRVTPRRDPLDTYA